MLPFLKNKQANSAGLFVKEREPDQPKEEKDMSHDEALDSCAKDVMSSIQRQDAKSLKEALKDFFEICDSMPHEEGEHTNENEEE